MRKVEQAIRARRGRAVAPVEPRGSARAADTVAQLEASIADLEAKRDEGPRDRQRQEGQGARGEPRGPPVLPRRGPPRLRRLLRQTPFTTMGCCQSPRDLADEPDPGELLGRRRLGGVAGATDSGRRWRDLTMNLTGSRKSLASMAAGATVLGLGLAGPGEPDGQRRSRLGGSGRRLRVRARQRPPDGRWRRHGSQLGVRCRDGGHGEAAPGGHPGPAQAHPEAGVAALARGKRTSTPPAQVHQGRHLRPRHHHSPTAPAASRNAQIRDQIKVMNDGLRGQDQPDRGRHAVQVRAQGRGPDPRTTTGTTGATQATTRSQPRTPTTKRRRPRCTRAGGVTSTSTSPRLGSGLLGLRHLPQRRSTWPLDGVVLLNDSLPGGAAAPYNEGDTATHEVGHWLGLFHTFENGCSLPGRLRQRHALPGRRRQHLLLRRVRSTPAPQPGTDPVHNFMSYGDDPCLDEFTRGQSLRMTLAWLVFRANR